MTTALLIKLAIPAPNLLTYCSANNPLVLSVSVVLFRKTSASPKCFSATAGSVLNRLFADELISLEPDVKVWVRVVAPAVKRLAVLAKVRAAEDDAEADMGAASRVDGGSSDVTVESLVSFVSSLLTTGAVLSPSAVAGAAASAAAVPVALVVA